ncbi:hypothetical protein Tco_1352458 [Tanacetum coccineum]
MGTAHGTANWEVALPREMVCIVLRCWKQQQGISNKLPFGAFLSKERINPKLKNRMMSRLCVAVHRVVLCDEKLVQVPTMKLSLTFVAMK